MLRLCSEFAGQLIHESFFLCGSNGRVELRPAEDRQVNLHNQPLMLAVTPTPPPPGYKSEDYLTAAGKE